MQQNKRKDSVASNETKTDQAKSTQAESQSEPLSEHYGTQTRDMVNATFAEGIERGVLLMRHSARTFHRDIHDLENRLTDHGRDLSRRMGRELNKDIHLRGYASPPHRCMETAELIIDAHQAGGGSGARTRPVEALGPFYALDQQKMWKGLSQADGLASYIGQWFDGAVPNDAMMPAEVAVAMVLRGLAGKLRAPLQTSSDQHRPHLDVCVSHDMTVYTVRHGVGLESLSGPDVEFLDGLLLFERDGRYWMRSQHGGEVALDV